MEGLVSGPVRKIRKSQRSVTGQVARNGASNAFESSLERDFFILVAWEGMETLVEQPFRIKYRDLDGSRHTYVPDAYVHYDGPNGHRQVVYEIKYRETLWANWAEWRPKYRAAVHFARERGMRFKIMTEVEIRTELLRSVKFLRGYRDITRDVVIEAHLARTLAALGESTPHLLLLAAYWTQQERMAALPYLWRMVATHRIYADLHSPLTMKTPIWIVVGEGFIWENPLTCR